MKRLFVLSAVLVMLVLPSVILAQGTCPSKMMMQKEAPELTEEQLAKLETMKLDHRMSCIKLEAELEILEIQMKQEMMKDEPSAKELEALVSKIGDAREKLHMNRINHMLQVRKIVGPEHWKRTGMHGWGMCDCGKCGGRMCDCGECGGGMKGMQGHGACCGMGEGCGRMGGHRGMGEGSCGMGGQGCMGGMKWIEKCGGETEGEKIIERRCIKIPAGD